MGPKPETAKLLIPKTLEVCLFFHALSSQALAHKARAPGSVVRSSGWPVWHISSGAKLSSVLLGALQKCVCVCVCVYLSEEPEDMESEALQHGCLSCTFSSIMCEYATFHPSIATPSHYPLEVSITCIFFAFA